MVHIIYKDNKPVGWEIKPTNEEEQKTAAIIRNLQFFGFNNTSIQYDGLSLIKDSEGKSFGNIKALKWVQGQYCDK